MIFQNRIDAAKQLAKNLEWVKNDDPLILAIPRGGVVIGDVIASLLNAKLDIIISRKIGAPHNPELAIGALMHDMSYFPNEDIIKILRITQKYIDSQISSQLKEIERRLMKFRGTKEYQLEGRTIILVDDGIATGATMLVVIQWIKKQKPKQLIVAIPVGPKESIDKLIKIVDKVVVIESSVYFNAVGEFYREFDQIEDSQVQEIMRKHGYAIT
ncbi:MAG: phosphoribosyltransferase [Nitrosopumilaceae archaeon]